jgi:hypothetical protein
MPTVRATNWSKAEPIEANLLGSGEPNRNPPIPGPLVRSRRSRVRVPSLTLKKRLQSGAPSAEAGPGSEEALTVQAVCGN